MMYGEVINNVFTGVLVQRGKIYKNKRVGINTTNAEYIKMGLYPIKGNIPPFNPSTHSIADKEYIVKEEYILVKYTIEERDLALLKIEKKASIKSAFATATVRPRVALTLENGTEIEVDGGREDKDNFDEEYKRLQRAGATSTVLNDSDNQKHPCTDVDIFNAYTAIIDNFALAMQKKWTLEGAIDSATSLEELEAVVWG